MGVRKFNLPKVRDCGFSMKIGNQEESVMELLNCFLKNF